MHLNVSWHCDFVTLASGTAAFAVLWMKLVEPMNVAERPNWHAHWIGPFLECLWSFRCRVINILQKAERLPPLTSFSSVTVHSNQENEHFNQICKKLLSLHLPLPSTPLNECIKKLFSSCFHLPRSTSTTTARMWMGETRFESSSVNFHKNNFFLHRPPA